MACEVETVAREVKSMACEIKSMACEIKSMAREVETVAVGGGWGVPPDRIHASVYICGCLITRKKRTPRSERDRIHPAKFRQVEDLGAARGQGRQGGS